MTHTPISILTLSSKSAQQFLMSGAQYYGGELPLYFNFSPMLQFVADKVGTDTYEGCQAGKNITEQRNLNFDFLLNKDSKYGIRPQTFTNPYMYYFLVREICKDRNWRAVKECFKQFARPHFSAPGIPVLPEQHESFHKSTVILNWWAGMEQHSIELAMQYRYMFVTDITNCYGTISHQSIIKALHREGTQVETKSNAALGNFLATIFRDMQQGATIGIPQGSTFYDLIAELVLGYADLLLSEKIADRWNGQVDFEVVRYRDDYRVFANSKELLEDISRMLQDILESLHMRLNTQKTIITDCVIDKYAIKPDKLYYILNTPIENKRGRGVDFDGFAKHMMFILMFGRKFPNSGQLKTLLGGYYNRLQWKLHSKKPLIIERVEPIISIALQLAIENTTCSHHALRVISVLLSTLQPETSTRLIQIIRTRLLNESHSEFNQIWLQNITFLQDEQIGTSPYPFALCKVVNGEDIDLWNNTWLASKYTKGFSSKMIVDYDQLRKLSPIIQFKERPAYHESGNDAYSN